MAQLEPYDDEFKKLGANLAYVAAEKRSGLWKPANYLAENPVSFPFLLDEDRAVTKAYGLYHPFGHDAFRIARPATLIIGRAGIVRYIYSGDNQLDRSPVEDVLGGLRAI